LSLADIDTLETRVKVDTLETSVKSPTNPMEVSSFSGNLIISLLFVS